MPWPALPGVAETRPNYPRDGFRRYTAHDVAMQRGFELERTSSTRPRAVLSCRPPTDQMGTICGSGARSRGVARRGHGLGESRRADHRAAPSMWAGEPAAREAVASRQIDSSMCAGPTATGDPTSVERLGRARTRRLLVGRGSKLFGGLPVGQVCD